MSEIRILEDRFSTGVYPKRDVVIIRGKGATVWDEHGQEYIDCVAGHGVASLGHANPGVVDAVREQAARLISCPEIFHNDSRATFLEKLVSVVPAGLNRIFLCNSGAEAVEAALKFARLHSGKPGVICASRAFHGRTMGALSATFNPAYRKGFDPLIPGFKCVPFNNFECMERAVDDETAAIILEPVQGEGGVHIADSDYLKQVRRLCDRLDILMIADEVQTGFCRTGRFFAVEYSSVQPDMMCLAKAIAGGLPMGAVLCRESIRIPTGKHGSTFGGNPLSCAAGSATIDFMLENKLWKSTEAKGAFFMGELKSLASPLVREVRGLGLMIGVEMKVRVKPIIQSLLDEGVLALPAGSTVLRFLPPLTITGFELERVVERLSKVLNRFGE